MEDTLTSRHEALTKYKKDGYHFVKGFFSAEEIAALDAEVRTAHAASPSTLDKKGLVFRAYLHTHSPFLRSFLSQPKVVDLLKDFIGPDFWLRKDQGVFKLPGGVEFPWHQDNGYNGIQDAYLQLWIPLTVMKPENGGLFILPESHRKGVLPHEFLGAHYAWHGDDRGAIAIHAEPGDILLFSSMLLHRTGPNATPRERVAYVAEFMSSEHYDPEARPPYFRVARGGSPDPGFVDSYRGSVSWGGRLKYVLPRIRRRFSIWKGRLGALT